QYENKDIQNFCREKKGSTVEESIQKYASPLHEALRARNEDAIRLLIGKKAVFSFTSWRGWQFLHACYEEPQICCLEILEAVLAFDAIKPSSDTNATKGALNYNQILATGERTFYEDIVANIDNSIIEQGSHERILLDLVKIPTLEITNGLIDAYSSLSDIRKYSDMKRQNPLNITDENGDSILHLLIKFKVYYSKTVGGHFDSNGSPHTEEVEEEKEEALALYPEEVTTEGQHDDAYEQIENQSILLQMIGRLYVKGIDINMKNKKGETPLMIEVSKFNPSIDVVKSLLHYRGNPNAQDIIGRTCLHTLLLQNYEENVAIERFLDLLIQHGADVNKADNYGNNPIFVELKRQKPRTNILRFLTQAPIDLRIEDMHGKTALHVALLSTYDEGISKEEITSVLLKSKNLNVLTYDNTGLSAFRIAMENAGSHDILKQLAQHDSCQFPLHACIKEDVSENIKIEALKQLMSTNNAKIRNSTKGLDDQTLLITAVQTCPNMVQLLNFLLTANIDINAKDTYGKNALFYLISSDTEFSLRESALNLLLAKGPSVHDKKESKDSHSPLSLAMQFITSRSFLFESLDPLEFPSEAITKKMTTEESPKKQKTRKDVQSENIFDLKIEIVQKILEIATVDLNFPVDKKQRTFLHYCASSRLADDKTRAVCEQLVRLGVDVDKRDEDGLTCIDMAFRYSVKNFQTLIFLLEKSKHLEDLDIDALLETTTSKNFLYEELVRYLQQCIFHRTKPRRNIFQYLASICYDPKSQPKAERDKVFDALLKSFSIDQKSKTGQIPLHIAIERNASVSCVRSFVRISKGCINTPDSEGNTALHLVLKSDRDDTDVCTIVKKMLKCDVAVDAQNEMLETPIMFAVCCPKDRTDTIVQLLKAKTDLFLTDRRKYNILHHCVGAPKNDIDVNALLSLFIDSDRTVPVMEKNTEGYTPLNLAAKTEKFSRILCILKLLEVKECTAHTVDRQGRTPLFNTAFFLEGDSPLVVLERLLRGCIFLMHGDSPSVTNNKGMTVFDICNEYEHRHLENLLESEKSEKMFTIVKQAWINVSSRYLIFDKNDNDPKLQFRSNVEERFRKLISDSLPFLSHISFDNIKNVELTEEENNLSSVPDLEQGTTLK
ncbi:serine/threonine-protein phosphatase 6 regulatory ankyrin repeat subunit B-like, partial [Saccostrea cucullata]|uniref:serine/threonine-protein phosphatase 6 regulatory ankyrin repeat subunit B-like n=1 Tax=Saccostrea cuccullata TaxID=36930 RepID=UPI002ED0B425